MKRTLCSIALLASGIASATTPIDGWYSSIFGGAAFVPSNLNNTSGGLTRSHAQYETGYDAGGSFGFKSTPIRYEGEITYLNVDLDRFRVSNIEQTGVKGFNHSLLAMANIYYDFPAFVANSIEPYLGLGIGYAYIDGQFKSTGPNGLTSYSPSSNAFAYQATGGLTYNFAEAYALNIGYRYVATARVDDFGKMFQTNLVNVGATYRFDGMRYK